MSRCDAAAAAVSGGSRTLASFPRPANAKSSPAPRLRILWARALQEVAKASTLDLDAHTSLAHPVTQTPSTGYSSVGGTVAPFRSSATCVLMSHVLYAEALSSESQLLPTTDHLADREQRQSLLQYVDQRIQELEEERCELRQQLSDLKAERSIIEAKMSET
ncbi:hypothetical protein CGC20_30690 [Leishmania donovani]|uniref:Uncharacterized protein n=1 Tax=Leishmania donovani TaxID=5661 RepID=A0A504WYM7_LEIDO|nr:hypothetical protein CGC20_30690 [Leishmania donovani]